jgi:hypothetical protein
VARSGAQLPCAPGGAGSTRAVGRYLDHLPYRTRPAFRETIRVVKPGGWVCHTTCFINPIHGFPKDFWRFTPDALRLLAEDAGCIEIEVGGWGNRDAWALEAAGFRYTRLPQDEAHPLFSLAMKNDPNWPIHVWVTAQKPA